MDSKTRGVVVVVVVDTDLEEPTTGAESFPQCSHCGAEIVATAVSAPATGTAVPCGCPVLPPALEFE